MDTDQILKVSLIKEVIKPTKPHRHADYHELILLSEGSGFHEIDDVNFDVIAPVMYYLRPGQTHCWNFSSVPKGHVILFKDELLRKEDIDRLYTFPAQIDLKGQPFLHVLLTEFAAEAKSGEVGTSVLEAYLHLLIAKLKQLSKTPKSTQSSIDQLFLSFKRLVNNHFLINKQLAFYTDVLSVTISVLNEACKKSAKKTALAVINERVLLEAKLLLSATGQPISCVADTLAFSDSSHFIKFFKHHTNLTPGQYREMAIGKQ